MTRQSSYRNNNTYLATTKTVVTNTVLQCNGAMGLGKGDAELDGDGRCTTWLIYQNVAELFPLEWLILCHVNFTSIKGEYICNQDRSSLTAGHIASLLEDVCKAF